MKTTTVHPCDACTYSYIHAHNNIIMIIAMKPPYKLKIHSKIHFVSKQGL